MQEKPSRTQAERRAGTQAALIAVRSLCLPRIHVLYDASDRRVAAENPQARTGDLADLKKEARRKIDYDIAVAVAKIPNVELRRKLLSRVDADTLTCHASA